MPRVYIFFLLVITYNAIFRENTQYNHYPTITRLNDAHLFFFSLSLFGPPGVGSECHESRCYLDVFPVPPLYHDRRPPSNPKHQTQEDRTSLLAGSLMG